MNANENNKHCNDMKISEIQARLNLTYNEAKKFKEQAELLGLFGVSKRFNSEDEACKWLDRNMPLLITSKRTNKYINPFVSGYAYAETVKHIAKKLFNAC